MYYHQTRKLNLRFWVGYGVPALLALAVCYAQAWG
jgi:hypothetical protein